MTTLDQPGPATSGPATSGPATSGPATSGPATDATARDTARAELAETLQWEPARLSDDVPLSALGGFDSLAMLLVRSWAEQRQLPLPGGELPETVGQLLMLAARSAPGRSVRVVGIRAGAAVAATGLGSTGSQTHAVLASPLSPTMANNQFSLTPVRPEDVGFLYSLATRPDVGFRWRYRGVAPAAEQFQQDLWTSVLTQYLVRAAGSGEPIGLVVAYAADSVQGLTHVGAVFAPEHTGQGKAAAAVAMFVRFLFHTFPLRKVYLEVPGFNWPQLQSADGVLFEVEGILRDHEFYAGRYWDKYLCAISRQRIEGAGTH